MKFTYDKEADAIALVLKDGRISKDVELAPGIFAGYDRAGELIEIQVLDVSERESPWVTLEAAAKMTEKSTRTILRWIDAGKIKPAKVGREYRFSPALVKQMSGEVEPPSRPRAAGGRRRPKKLSNLNRR